MTMVRSITNPLANGHSVTQSLHEGCVMFAAIVNIVVSVIHVVIFLLLQDCHQHCRPQQNWMGPL